MSPLTAVGVGQTLGKYVIRRELGRGSMGVVYLAEDQSLRREVALKVLNGSLTSEPQFVEWFRREARSVASVYHPGIVRVHAFEEIEDHLVIDMEYVAGGSLADILIKRGVTAQETCRIASQLLNALACCHDSGIVHRDIKPTNILVDSHGIAKLSDFGLAKILEHQLESSLRSMSSSAFFLGTPRYAPPEAWDGAAGEPSWDLYSLGMVLYEALSGQTPYTANTPLALVKEMAQTKVSPLCTIAPHVSTELGAIVDQMISSEAADRGDSASDILRRLREVPEYEAGDEYSGPTVRVPLPNAASRAKTRRRRLRPQEVWGIALGILALANVAIVTYAILRPPGPGRTEPRTAPATEPGPTLSQEQIGDTALLSADSLPSLIRNAEDGKIYDVLLRDGAGDEGGRARGLLLDADETGTSPFFVQTSSGIWVMRFSLDENVCAVEGHWAEYQGPAGSVFRYGTVKGAGSMIAGEAWILTLDFVNATNNDHSRVTTTLTPDPSAADTGFWLALEENSHLPALIENELLSRDWTWPSFLDSYSPALIQSRVMAVPLEMTSQAFALDGRLDEAWWKHADALDSGVYECALPAQPWNSDAWANFRVDRDFLYLGVRCSGVPDGQLGLRVAIGAHPRIPVTHSPRWQVDYREDEGIVTSMTTANQSHLWECDWEITDARPAHAWIVEGRLPWKGLDVTPNAIGQVRLRVNMEIYRTGSGNRDDVLLRWGYPELEKTEHGAVIETAF